MPRFNKKWKAAKEALKKDLIKEFEENNNRALAMCILKAFNSSRQFKHITEVWHFLGTKYPGAYKEYRRELQNKIALDHHDIFQTFYFACPHIFDKHKGKIPGIIAMGVSYSVALSFLNKLEKERLKKK